MTALPIGGLPPSRPQEVGIHIVDNAPGYLVVGINDNSRLFFDERNGNVTITVTLLDDSLIEGDETFLIGLNEPTGGVPIATRGVQVVIQDSERNLACRSWQAVEKELLPRSSRRKETPFLGILGRVWVS